MGVIRLFLALAVTISHHGHHYRATDAAVAVMAFFVISGFYMALVLNEKYKDDTKAFYLARYLRIWPSYFVVIAVATLYTNQFAQLPTLASVWTYFTSATLFFHETLWWFGLVEGHNDVVMTQDLSAGGPKIHLLAFATPAAHMWSVGIELTFYAIAPFVARSPRRLVAFFFAAYAVHIAIYVTLGPAHPFYARSAFGYMWLFAAGMIGYWIWRKVGSLIPQIPAHTLWLTLACAFCVYWVSYFDPLNEGWNPIACDLFLLLFVGVVVVAFEATKHNRLDRAVGELSYPLYLVHWPLLTLVFTQNRAEWPMTILFCAVSILVAALLYALVDRPIERFKRGWRKASIGYDSATQPAN